jgi:integrase/recombinase XerD
VADFHALRHTFITNLVKAGVQPKDAKELARHSTSTLTMDRYAHVGVRDTAAALSKLTLQTLPMVVTNRAREQQGAAT